MVLKQWLDLSPSFWTNDIFADTSNRPQEERLAPNPSFLVDSFCLILQRCCDIFAGSVMVLSANNQQLSPYHHRLLNSELKDGDEESGKIRKSEKERRRARTEREETGDRQTDFT